MPFDRVLDDFAEGMELERVGERSDLGTITLRPHKEFTAAERLDLLIEILEKDNFRLVRYARTFYLHPADRPVDSDQLDTVTVEELSQRKSYSSGRRGGRPTR